MTARCEAAERVAAGKADAVAERASEIPSLRALLERQRKDSEVQAVGQGGG